MPSIIYTSAYDSFRTLLKEVREDKGVTQATLAARIGVPQSYVSKYETGERRLDFVETLEICRALGCPSSEFTKAFETRLERLGHKARSVVLRRRSES